MTAELVILFGLLSAVTWGAGDFSGGLASKKTHVYVVVLFAHLISLILLIIFALVFEPFPSINTLVFGAVGGIVGGIGLISLYKGLAEGKMSVVAPLAAVITVLIPLLYSIITEDLPSNTQSSGILIAIIGIFFVSQNNEDGDKSGTNLLYPIIAGISFGLFFIFLSFAGDSSVLWTLVAARTSSVFILGIIISLSFSQKMPRKNNLRVIAIAGILDTLGNIFFILASQQGRLDLASILSSFYPASTVLLARIIQKELISTKQKIGIVLSLIAIVLISI